MKQLWTIHSLPDLPADLLVTVKKTTELFIFETRMGRIVDGK
jgi:hypothetical protein